MKKLLIGSATVIAAGAVVYFLWSRDPKARAETLWEEYEVAERALIEADTNVAKTYDASIKSRRLPREILDHYDRATAALEEMVDLHVEIEETLDDARSEPELVEWLDEQDKKVAGGTPHLRRMLTDYKKSRRSAVAMMEITEKREDYFERAKMFKELQDRYFQNRDNAELVREILKHLEGMVELGEELVELAKEHKHPGVLREIREQHVRISKRLSETQQIAERLATR